MRQSRSCSAAAGVAVAALALAAPVVAAASVAASAPAAASAAAAAAAAAPSFAAAAPAPQDRYDIVLAGGRVMDPETGLDAVRHVGITGSVIVSVSETPLDGDVVVDATGLVVAPGFIDLHAHGQTNRANEFQARDGVTTALEMESGVGDLTAYLAERDGRAVLNYGATVSHMINRAWAMFDRADLLRRAEAMLDSDPAAGLRELDRIASGARYETVDEDEFGALWAALAMGLAEGALGIGMAHQYYPGASLEEILDVFRFAAYQNTTIYTHVRDMKISAMQEVIANAVATGASLHIVHANSSSLWNIEPILELIGGAQSRGFDITTEVYPYTAPRPDSSRPSSIPAGRRTSRSGTATFSGRTPASA